MGSGLLGFMELFIVMAFVIGWGVLELMLLRRDQRRQREAERMNQTDATTDQAFPPKPF